MFNQDARRIAVAALARSMQVVGKFQQGRCLEPLGSKLDGSHSALPVDKASEAAGKEILRKIPGISIHGEETGLEGDDANDILVALDGCDGSASIAAGAGNSTVIVAAYSKRHKEVFFCAVGEPQSGRIWTAHKGMPTGVMVYSLGGTFSTFENAVQVRVSAEPISFKARVFPDSVPNFKRDGRVIMSTSDLNRLHANIQAHTGMLMLGSNAEHQALVAHGSRAAVGSITTAIGGWWDVCGVLLVLQAGGCAAAFRVGHDGELIECNPLDVMSYDILVTANSQATLAVLTEAVRAAKLK